MPERFIDSSAVSNSFATSITFLTSSSGSSPAEPFKCTVANAILWSLLKAANLGSYGESIESEMGDLATSAINSSTVRLFSAEVSWLCDSMTSCIESPRCEGNSLDRIS